MKVNKTTSVLKILRCATFISARVVGKDQRAVLRTRWIHILKLRFGVFRALWLGMARKYLWEIVRLCC